MTVTGAEPLPFPFFVVLLQRFLKTTRAAQRQRNVCCEFNY